MRSRACLGFVVAWLASPLLGTAWGAEPAEVDCNRCHGDAVFVAGKKGSPGEDAALLVPDSTLLGTGHDSLRCVSCHLRYDDGWPHRPGKVTVTCESCHESVGADWAASSHAVVAADDGPTCVRCHGVHRVFGAADSRSPTHSLKEAQLCGECHGDPGVLAAYFADPADSLARSAVDTYHETVHGLAVDRSGLVVSATCSDCHRAHLILPADSASSSIHRTNVPETCGACHAGVLEEYSESAHGTSLAEAADGSSPEAPVCTTCHAAHGVVEVDAAWRTAVVEECGPCHQRVYDTYFGTYHGKVTRLGAEIAAKCSDCHTPHSNLPAADPRSSVHPSNIVGTCAHCHDHASARFAQYFVHADRRDRENYPQVYWAWTIMVSLMTGVFGFFGSHSILWLVRSLADARRAGAEAVVDAPPPDSAAPPAGGPPDAGGGRK
jgi:nitrate/TMAO reductase-like tetraheme cytochrome c subunit